MDFSNTAAVPSGQTAAALPADEERQDPDAKGRGLAILLFVLVGTLALLLASFPARNSDLAMHLASGRALFGGDLSATSPPFALDAHSTWLYDLLCHGVFSVLGDSALVAVKALLVVGLSLVLMRMGRIHGWWIPAALTALALLTMSTRLSLQPVTVSYFLFAATLWMLRNRRAPAAAGAAGLMSLWPLLVLFVIWVNVSGWFLLGLGAVACFGLGRLLDDSSGRPEKGTGPLNAKGPVPFSGQDRLRAVLWGGLGMSVLAGVCLLNPLLWQAFEPPPELHWQAAPATLPALLATEQVVSPFLPNYWASFGQSPAGLAYFPLLGLSLLSLLLNVRRWRWQWFLPWLALALLSALQVRVSPFFAVLAAPVSAWNFQEFFGAHAEDPRRWSWRALMVVLGLAFLMCAWPGWLQRPPYEPRRWAIEPSPALVRSARACQRWHEQGKLARASKGLHLARETAQVFSWLCPEAKGVWDESLSAVFLGQSATPADFHERLRAAGIHHVIVHHPDRGRLFAALNALWADPKQWPLLYLEGDVVIFGWRDPAQVGQADLFAGWELDLQQLALRPPPAKLAPRHRPEQDAEARRWWDAFWKPAPARSFARDEASVYLLRAESLRLAALLRHLVAWESSQAAGMAASARGWTSTTCFMQAALGIEVFRPQLPHEADKSALAPGFNQWIFAAQNQFVFQRDDVPPEILYLAIRAARRALLHNPQDANTYQILGDCYLRLWHDTRERAWGRQLQELMRLRQAQASEALNQAVLLNPELIQAHMHLAALYVEIGYLDLALQHRRKHLELFRKAGPASGVSPELFGKQEEHLDREAKRLAKAVQEAEHWHSEAAAGARVLERARLALHKGLAAKARQILVDSDISAFGPQGMAIELELLLRSGRAKDVREWTKPEQEADLGAGAFRWMRAQAFAASGDYMLADEEFAHLASGGRDPEALPPRALIALLVGQNFALESLLWGNSLGESIRRVVVRSVFLDRVGDLAQSMRKEADVMVLRGLLDLEQGRMEEANSAFRLALARWNETGARGAVDFDARIIAQGWLHKLQ